MKKKLLIKESELKEFVENFLNEEQLELDFPKDSLTEMMEEKYQEIVTELNEALEKNDFEKMNDIYDEKIFNITKNLHKTQGIKIVDKFNMLEDVLIDYLELHKEYSAIKNELDKSEEELKNLF